MGADNPDFVRMIMAAHQVATSRGRARVPTMVAPSVQQVCSELWLLGELVPIDRVIAACRQARLPLAGLPAAASDQTREVFIKT